MPTPVVDYKVCPKNIGLDELRLFWTLHTMQTTSDYLMPRLLLLAPLPHQYQEGYFDMVEISNAEELAVYCVVCKLMEHESGQMRLTEIGQNLSTLFRPAQQLKYGKLKALVEAHPDKLRYSQTTQDVSLCTDSQNSSFPASDDQIQSVHPAPCLRSLLSLFDLCSEWLQD